MAATASLMVPLGTPAPDFSLPDVVTGRHVRLADVCGPRATVVMFLCNHCPYVRHVNDELVRLATHYRGRGVGFVAISANDADAYPDDGPAEMAEVAREVSYPFPYLYDATQATARAFGAVCTPDFFVFDASHRLAYRGQLDDARPGNGRPVDGADLRGALDALCANLPVATAQRPGLGCNIKWKNGG